MGELLQFAARQQRKPPVRELAKSDVACSDPSLASSFEAFLSAIAPEENDAHVLLALSGFGVRTVRVKDGLRLMTYARQVGGGILSVDLYSDDGHRPVSFDANGQAGPEECWIRYLPVLGDAVGSAVEAALTALENWLLQRDLSLML